jgi:DNA ligase 1
MSSTPIFDMLDTKEAGVIFTETLYKKDNTGKLRSWTITVTDELDKASISIDYGQIDGKKANKTTYVTVGKNIGKANETTYAQQAIAEAESKVASQLKDTYVRSLEEVREPGTKGGGSVQCMLAATYDPYKKQSGSKDLKGYKLEGVRVGSQVKIDGVRRATKVNATSATMYSRGGDVFNTLPHIEAELVESFKKYQLLHPEVTELWLDGEAYSDAIPFNRINGITRKGAKNLQDKADAKLIKLHLYDVVDDRGYEERSTILEHFRSEHVEPLGTNYVIATEENLRAEFAKAIELGYEGLIIRQLGVGYVNKRSAALLKYKEFEDKEFLIVGIESSVEGDRAGTVRVKMDVEAYDRDGKLIEDFGTGIALSMEERKHMWNNPGQYIGKWATINFFGRSEYNVPRFGRFKDLRKDL